MNFSVICASDRCSKKLCEDKSGPLIKEMTEALGETLFYEVLPDDKIILAAAMGKICDEIKPDVLFTTGGTGLAPRDVTPEATKAVIQKEVPGISEAIRQKSLEITPMAMLSRGISGIRGSTLIINLPGSPKAVKESLEVVLPVLPHAVETLKGETLSCGGNYGK